MYKLGDHFTNNYAGHLATIEDATIRNSTYRISVLTERLVRLEYTSDGMFNNYETSIVKNRRFPVPEFIKHEDDNVIQIETAYFTLYYSKASPFSSRTLNVEIKKKNGIMVKKK